MYPGTAKMAKMASCISVLWSSEACGLSSLRISGVEMVLP